MIVTAGRAKYSETNLSQCLCVYWPTFKLGPSRWRTSEWSDCLCHGHWWSVTAVCSHR